jgi:hypothetical protein
MTFILLLIGAVVGFFLYPIVNTLFGCDCDYELLFNRCIDQLPIGCRFTMTAHDRDNNYKLDRSLVYVTYKKCRKCGQVMVAISNGTDREFHYDAEHVRNIIEAKMKNEKDAADAALLERTNERLAASDTEKEMHVMWDKVRA